jgi:hypothetical protein
MNNRHEQQARTTGTNNRHEQQARTTGTNNRHEQQARTTGTNNRHEQVVNFYSQIQYFLYRLNYSWNNSGLFSFGFYQK